MNTTDSWDLPCLESGTFSSPEEAQQAINAFARDHGYAVVLEKYVYDKSAPPQRRRAIYACDRHGGKKPYQPRANTKRRPNAASRRCMCPMRINVLRQRSDHSKWFIVLRGIETAHNHPPSDSPSAHPKHRQSDLTDDLRKAIDADAQTGVSASQSLARIVAANPKICIQPQDVYNARNKSFNFRLEGKTRMRFLLDTLSGDSYFVTHTIGPEKRISHLFFAARESIDIYKDNPDVLLMDCTYKTNKFKMPLLNIVGVSGMNMTIHVAQAYLKGEEKDDYIFALKSLRTLMTEQNIPLPQLILVDRDLALLNALEEIFPEVPALLCIWHVVKDVEAHARRSFPKVLDPEKSTPLWPKWKDSSQHREFCGAFYKVIRSTAEEEYNKNREYLRKLSSAEADYVDRIWLDIWKRRLVHYGTDQVTHFGLQATSRVEGYHSALKRWLRSSRGDMLTAFTRMQHWWSLTNRKYSDRLCTTKIKALTSLKKPLFHGVTTVIHNYALKRCLDQLNLITMNPCTGRFTRTTGIPCSHKLAVCQRSNTPLKPSDFHAHWWVDRSSAPVPPPPIVLEPLTIRELRAAWTQQYKATRSQKKGGGVRGTRRRPSRFEQEEQTASSTASLPQSQLPTLAATLVTAPRPISRLPPMRFHPNKK